MKRASILAFISGTLSVNSALAGEVGKLKREVWEGIGGDRVEDLTFSAKFRGTPDVSDTIAGAESAADIGDDYGQRLRGYITAPATGGYTFWIAGDNSCSFAISTDESKFNSRVVASVTGGWVDPHGWDERASQQSVSINLIAGQKYFIEILHKEDWGGDHVSLAWKLEGGVREIVPPSVLESFVVDSNDADNDDLPDSWEIANGLDPSDNGDVDFKNGFAGDLDGDGFSNGIEFQFGGNPQISEPIAGAWRREYWKDISGTRVSDFVTSPAFLEPANYADLVTGPAKSQVDFLDNYGQRLRGYIVAPESGFYTFYVSSDDSSEIWLSTSTDPFQKKLIARVDGAVSEEEWDRSPTQKSELIYLEAGHSYYIESLHKEGGVGDHFEVAWETPTIALELIPAEAMLAFPKNSLDLDDDGLPDAWEINHNLNPADNGHLSANNGAMGDPDGDGVSNLEEFLNGGDPNVASPVPGGLSRDVWFGQPDGELSLRTEVGFFYRQPDSRGFWTSSEGPRNVADDFSERLRGYVTAPSTGDYIFWVSGDDACELRLSESDSKLPAKTIAWTPVSVGYENWNEKETQQSEPIHLVAGSKYYIEILHREHSVDDYVSIAWTKPDSEFQLIPPQFLSSFAGDLDDMDDDYLKDTWEQSHSLSPVDNGNITSSNGPLGDPDGDLAPNWLEFQLGTNPTSENSVEGALSYKVWLNVEGYTVADLLHSPAFLNPPNVGTLIPTSKGYTNYADSYGSQLRGYLCPKISGEYKFWAAGDNRIEVFLSTNDSPLNKSRILSPQFWTGENEWDLDQAQLVEGIHLEAGQNYYIEIDHKDSDGWDSCSVAWQIPGHSREIISGDYLKSFVPRSEDSDDDGLLDSWELANGLDPADNGAGNPANGYYGDKDGDGLSNAEEYSHGTRADLADTDGDGISDYDELKTLHTNALLGDVFPFELESTVAGSDFVDKFGDWSALGTKAKNDSTRGWLEYRASVSSSGIYLLCVNFSSAEKGELSNKYRFILDVDGHPVGNIETELTLNDTGSAKILTPWLDSGPHTIRMYLDNSLTHRKTNIESLEFLSARGSDSNTNGVPDWVENRVEALNGIDTTAPFSLISPACIEGRSKYLTLSAASSDFSGELLMNSEGADGWYTNVPLRGDGSGTELHFEFENGSKVEDLEVNWRPTNLLASVPTTLRVGDALRLTAFSADQPEANPNGQVNLLVNGQSHNYPASQPLTYRFEVEGDYHIQVTYSLNGISTSRDIWISAVAMPSVNSPVCAKGIVRDWDATISPAIVIDCPEAVYISTVGVQPTGETRFKISCAQEGVSQIALRSAGNNSVLGTIPVRCITLRDGSATSVTFAEDYGDGSYRVEMPTIISKAYNDLLVKYDIFEAGVLFMDGSIHEVIEAPQFDGFSTYLVEFMKVGDAGSICYRSSLWQNGFRIAISN